MRQVNHVKLLIPTCLQNPCFFKLGFKVGLQPGGPLPTP